MTDPSQVCINVVYIPGTVRPLSRFVPSWIEHTECSFRLISNSCSQAEDRFLRALCDVSPRLRYVKVATEAVVPLGKLLTDLVVRFDDDPFAFMDSDMAATGDFMAEMAPALNGHEAVFSGTPVWARSADQVLRPDHREVAGPHNRTDGGIGLGSSYFGLYRRGALDQAMRTCRVTPDKYSDLSECDPGFVSFMANNGLLRDDYVPPKILNIAFAFCGFPIAYVEAEHLHHIGGFSITTYSRVVERGGGERTDTQREILDYREFRSYMQRKNDVCARLSSSFASLDAGGPPVTTPAFDSVLEERLRTIEAIYVDGIAALARLGIEPEAVA